ncbi:hypothetical protein AB4254_11125 [Vibrio breoganii]
MMTNFSRNNIAIITLSILLAGCGGDDGGTDGNTTEPDECINSSTTTCDDNGNSGDDNDGGNGDNGTDGDPDDDIIANTVDLTPWSQDKLWEHIGIQEEAYVTHYQVFQPFTPTLPRYNYEDHGAIDIIYISTDGKPAPQYILDGITEFNLAADAQVINPDIIPKTYNYLDYDNLQSILYDWDSVTTLLDIPDISIVISEGTMHSFQDEAIYGLCAQVDYAPNIPSSPKVTFENLNYHDQTAEVANEVNLKWVKSQIWVNIDIADGTCAENGFLTKWLAAHELTHALTLIGGEHLNGDWDYWGIGISQLIRQLFKPGIPLNGRMDLRETGLQHSRQVFISDIDEEIPEYWQDRLE